jgi:two-component system alkaline phosphatase synthesis response regulator PhoP
VADTSVNRPPTTQSLSPMNHRILVIDDSPLVHELARLALESAGWQVDCAESGAAALAATAKTSPDAILLDVEMPELDGPATLAALRAQPALVDTPVVFLTGHDAPAERARLAALDVQGVLSKPFELGRLADQLAELAGWSR